MGDDSPAGRVLIAVDSAMTCNQIQDYLIHGPEKVMRQLLSKLEEPSAPKEKEVHKTPAQYRYSRLLLLCPTHIAF